MLNLEIKYGPGSIDKSELENYRNMYHIISQQLIERELYITTYSPEQPQGFFSVYPLLEHVYFQTLTQNLSYEHHILFEIQRLRKHWFSYAITLPLWGIGIFCGNNFNMSVSDGIYLNSPYTIGFITGMLSLFVIFIVIIYAIQQLFKDQDSKFYIVFFFSFPLS